MESSSQRQISYVQPNEKLDEVATRLAAALSGTGPALAFSEIPSLTHVNSSCAIVVSTTGSSGVQKDVALSATALLSNARASLKFLGANLGDRWSLLLPITHIAGINVVIRSLELGTIPIDLRRSDTYIDVDFTAIVPTQLHDALHGNEDLLNHLKQAKAVLVGGAALDRNLAEKARSAGITIVTTYGMTETSGGCVYNGMPLDGVSVRVDNELIVISGKTLADGYLNHPELWTDTTSFTTSDRGEIIDGVLTVLGRADDVIISGGSNISLHQVEEILLENFPGLQCVALGVADARWGQALHVAYVGDLDIPRANTILAQRIGEKGRPKGFHLLPELPLIGIGKVDRKALENMLL